MAYVPHITKGKTCHRCGTNSRYIRTGRCVECHKREMQKHVNNDLVNKRRALEKRRDEEQIKRNIEPWRFDDEL